MAPRTSDTKQRMVDAAADLLSQQGTAGTTVDAVLARSGAPRGSVYHHFPGGRTEIVLSAVEMVGSRIADSIETASQDGPLAVLDAFGAFWRRQLTRTDYRAGCPVVALATGGAEQIPGAEELVGDVFGSWHAQFVRALCSAGAKPRRARQLATLVLSATQGAVVLARARRSLTPLDDVVAELAQLLREVG